MIRLMPTRIGKRLYAMIGTEQNPRRRRARKGQEISQNQGGAECCQQCETDRQKHLDDSTAGQSVLVRPLAHAIGQLKQRPGSIENHGSKREQKDQVSDTLDHKRGPPQKSGMAGHRRGQGDCYAARNCLSASAERRKDTMCSTSATPSARACPGIKVGGVYSGPAARTRSSFQGAYLLTWA